MYPKLLGIKSHFINLKVESVLLSWFCNLFSFSCKVIFQIIIQCHFTTDLGLFFSPRLCVSRPDDACCFLDCTNQSDHKANRTQTTLSWSKFSSFLEPRGVGLSDMPIYAEKIMSQR